MDDFSNDYDSPAFDIETNLNFLDDIDQYDNTDSCDKSSSTKSSTSENRAMNSSDKNMVMIDQKQLQELMQAKLILESQQMANAQAYLAASQDTGDLIGAAFNSGIFAPTNGRFSSEKAATRID
jgi:hypothetical protein